MNDTTVIMGYGVKVNDLLPLLDMRKLVNAANATMDTQIDVGDFENREDETVLSELDYELIAETGTYDLCCLFQALGALRDLNLWENARSEFYLLYARHFPWEESDNPPKSIEDVKQRIAGVLLPFARDGVEAEDIASEAYDIEDID